MQLRPGETFVIVRQLDNPADATQYYVQAVIRNSKTDVILDTLNLDDKGSQRFTKSWQVAADPSGEGMYIDVESRVFTDVAYSVYSDVYAKENAVYLVADRPNPGVSQGVGGGEDVDYKRIKSIVDEVVSSRKETQPTKTDTTSIMRGIRRLEAVLAQLEQPEDVDLTPIKDEIGKLATKIDDHSSDVGKKITEKEVTQPTDLTPVLEAIKQIDVRDLIGALKEILSNMHNLLGDDMKKMLESVQQLEKKIDGLPMMVFYSQNGEKLIAPPPPPLPEPEKKKPNEEPIKRVRKI